MTRMILCDVCGQRLDGADLETEAQHVRALLRLEQQGQADVALERDFCESCAEDKRLTFEAQPFTDSVSKRPSGNRPAEVAS